MMLGHDLLILDALLTLLPYVLLILFNFTVVDDIEGKLPLNHTKQDVAFGEQFNGEGGSFFVVISCSP